MRILVLGGNGMLGSQLCRQLAGGHELATTVRGDAPSYSGRRGRADAGAQQWGAQVYAGVDVRHPDAVPQVLAHFRPDAVVNAIGLIKQRPEGQSNLPALELNAILPHRLALLCQASGARLVHLSTDCVFSGRTGGYTEADAPDAGDVYGRTKLLGEVDDGSALVLRSSIIGLETGSARSLVEWFLAQRGVVPGYTRAIYSGLTTQEMARLIELVLLKHPDITGLWHAASAPISKYDLLRGLADKLGRTDVQVVPDDSVVCDRSLRADRLQAATGYVAPSWDSMLTELVSSIQERADLP